MDDKEKVLKTFLKTTEDLDVVQAKYEVSGLSCALQSSSLLQPITREREPSRTS